MTRRIREDEERIQNTLREKSVHIPLSSKNNGKIRSKEKKKAANNSKNSLLASKPKNANARKTMCARKVILNRRCES